jgi:hypothetical protein
VSTKSAANGNTGPGVISAPAGETEEGSLGQAARDEDIGRRAYKIYLERGEKPGLELDNWLQAERELAAAVLSHAQAG